MTKESFSIHSSAKGFDQTTEAYESGRPDFPQDAIDFLQKTLGLAPGVAVLDLAAGTGKLTRRLVPLGVSLTAVEPVEGMRQKFASLLPQVPLLAGTAEAIPMKDQSVDVVLVSVAFHWFDGEKALAEIHRVLKPGGRLALLWNVRDESVPWMGQLTQFLETYEGGTPRYKTFEWKKAFDRTTLFTPLERKDFPFAQRGNIQTLLDRARSISFIGALEKTKQDQVIAQAKEILEQNEHLKDQKTFDIPYSTALYWCSKK